MPAQIFRFSEVFSSLYLTAIALQSEYLYNNSCKNRMDIQKKQKTDNIMMENVEIIGGFSQN